MTTTTTTKVTACRVLRCNAAAAWQLTIIDNGHTIVTGCYCAECAARRVATLAKPGRQLTLDAVVA